MIRVGLADDDSLIRTGLTMILEQTEDIEVVAVAANGHEAVAVAKSHSPDVILMDVRMPALDGIEATRQITAAGGSRVIILTTFELDEYVFEALRAGASGFLLKRTPPAELIEAIRVVAAGEALLAPSVTRRLIEAFVDRRPPAVDVHRVDRLTDREREVLGLIARGHTNQELSELLFISENTVKTHVKRVLMKIGARDRTQAVVIAYECGLVS